MINKTLKSKTALSVLTGLTVAMLPAGAVPVQSGDIFVGFRASGGTGASTSYLVKLGPYSQFQNAGSALTLSSLGNLGADLSANFGSNWNTRSDLYWGVFGVTNATVKTIFGSRARTNVGTPAAAWAALTQTQRNSTASQLVSVIFGNTGGFEGLDATTNSSVAAFQTNVTNSSSYNYQVATAGTSDFGSTSGWTSIEGDFGNGVAGTALDLFRISSAGVTSPGYFTITGSGVINFTPTIAPSITSQPLAASVYLGDDVTFTVTPAGTAPFTYQWKKDGVDLVGQTSQSLILSQVSGSQAGSYTVVITNGAGSITSNAAVLTATPDIRDSDGDGFSNYNEYLAGTNPNNPGDFFSVNSITRTASGTVVAFKTIASRSYEIAYSADLSAGSWTSIGSVVVPAGANPATYQYVDTDPVRKTRSKGFYRVGVFQTP